MYRITAINNESDTEEEDDTKVTKEAEVCIVRHNLNKFHEYFVQTFVDFFPKCLSMNR